MAEVRIEITCPGCRKLFHVQPAEQGNIADCPHCQGWVDIPVLVRPPTIVEIDEAIAQRHASVYDRQLAEGDRQIAQAQQSLDKRDVQDVRFDRILDRMEATIAHWDRLAERLDKLASRFDIGGDA